MWKVASSHGGPTRSSDPEGRSGDAPIRACRPWWNRITFVQVRQAAVSDPRHCRPRPLPLSLYPHRFPMTSPIAKPRVAIIGLGFGAEFIPIYQRIECREMAAICQRNPNRSRRSGDKFGIEKRYRTTPTSSPILTLTPSTQLRPSRTRRAHPPARLRAGKHVPCTVRWRPRSRTARQSSISGARPDSTT